MADITDEGYGGTMPTAVLKALANQTRRRVLRELSLHGSGRAADLATSLGLPANQISFHLRVLADAGLISEAAELARDRRDRVWRVVEGPRELGSPTSPTPDPVLGAAVATGIGADLHEMLDRVLRWAPAYASGADSDVHGTVTQSSFRLTPDEFEELTSELNAVIDRYRGRHRGGADADVRGWDLVIAAADDRI